MSGALIAAELASGSWAAGMPRRGPSGDTCASIPGVAGIVLQYVRPLRDAFDDLLGDAGAVTALAAEWDAIDAALDRLVPMLDAARRALGELDGRTARALRERDEDLVRVCAETREWTAATAAALRTASDLVQAVRLFVCDFLAEASRLADELFRITLNPFELADRVREFAEAALDLVEAAGRLVEGLLDALFALSSLLQRLMPLVVDALDDLRETVAHMLPLVLAAAGAPAGPFGSLFGIVGGGTLENFLADAPAVGELDPDELTGSRRANWESSDRVMSLASLADLVRVNGTTDAIGGENATAIDIKKMRRADGSFHWVVSLPSTQDWELGGDTGAVNDRDSNVALLLDNPLLKSQYERVVLEAMRDAGVPPGGDVVLTGFSQGGIMAANLASDSGFPYNTVGVVTNGSPIDTFDIPAHIPVYAFQHATDPVPMLDATIVGPTPSNVHRVVLADPEGAHGASAHDNRAYAESVQAWERAYAAAHGSVPPGSELFGGEVVDHSVFSAAER